MLASIILGALAGTLGYSVVSKRTHHNKTKWLGFAGAFILVFALSQTLLIPLVEARMAQDAINDRRRGIEWTLKDDLLFKRMAATDPQALSALRADLEAALNAGADDDALDQLIDEHASRALLRYLGMYDTMLVGTFKEYVKILKPAMTGSPNLCQDIILDPQQTSAYIAAGVAQDKQAARWLEAYNTYAVTADPKPVVIDWDQADQDLQEITGRVEKRYPHAIEILRQGGGAENPDGEFCPVLSEYLDAILALPTPRAANVLRSLYVDDIAPGTTRPPASQCSTPFCM